MRCDFRELKNIVLCKDYDNTDDSKIPGGYVKPPNRGINEWIATFDFASLYPTTQRQFFISPENFKGFVMADNPGYAKFEDKINKIEDDYIICVNGAVFSREYSVTVKFLENTYNERKRNKTLMNVEYKIMEEEMKELKLLEEELAELERA